jgi:hypothetical protein
MIVIRMTLRCPASASPMNSYFPAAIAASSMRSLTAEPNAIFLTDGGGADGVLDGVIVDLDSAVF